jgi:hypothetical protein
MFRVTGRHASVSFLFALLVELYNSEGRLTSLVTVADPFGRSLAFIYDSAAVLRIRTMTDPDSACTSAGKATVSKRAPAHKRTGR